MVHTKIHRYLKKYCDSRIASSGKKLYDSGAVLTCEYNPEKDEGGAIVQGTKKYPVAVHNLLDDFMGIETYCNCPHEWDTVCKHQVAALYAIEAKFKADIEVIPVVKTSFGELEINKKLFVEFQKSAEINGVTVVPKSISETQVEFELEVKTNYSWNKEIVEVVIVREGHRWMIKNCCKSSFNTVCKHQAAVIHFIKKHWQGYDFFEKMTHLEEEKIRAREAYHLNDITDFDSFFKLVFDEAELEFRFVPKNASFKSREDILSFLENYKENKRKSEKVMLPFSVENDAFGYGLGFHFDPGSRRQNSFHVQLLTGKFNSTKTKLANSFQLHDGLFWVPDHLRLFRDNLNYLLRKRAESDSAEGNYNMISQYLTEHLSLISSQHNFENEDFHMAAKSGLKPMEILEKPLEISFELTKGKRVYHLAAKVDFKGEKLDVSSGMEIVCGHFFRWGQTYAVIPDFMTYATAGTLLDTPVLTIHEHEKKELLLILNELGKQHQIELNQLIPVRELTLNKPRFQVFLSEQHSFLIIKPEVTYENGERFPLLEREYAWAFDPESETAHTLIRNTAEENDFLKLLEDFDPSFAKDSGQTYFFKNYDDVKNAYWFFGFFTFCQENEIEVFGLKELKRLNYSPFQATVSMEISSNIDWFEAHLKVSFGNEIVPLKRLRESLERREKFVKLSDGSIGLLPEKWIKKMQAVLRAGEIKNENIQISKLKWNLVDTLFDEINDLDVLKEISDKKNRLKHFSGIDEIQIPSTVKATLREYQKEGFYWLNFLDEFNVGGCLADDMGLGKTVQLIAFLAHQKKLKNGTSIVVVPKSLLFNWSAEIDKFCPSLKYTIYHGNRTFDKELLQKSDVVITTYTTVANDIAKLKSFAFNYAILDESQAIKNPGSKRFKSVCLLNARNKIVATGTPVENNTFDLYAQFHFINPGLFGSQKDFKERYALEIDGKGDLERTNELKQIIHPFILRRTKQQVANDLPEKTEQVLMVEMGEEQRRIYDLNLQYVRDQILGKIDSLGLENSKMYVLQGLMRLRQICNSPALLKDAEFDSRESAKIDLLMEQLLPLVRTNKVLVFSQFTSMLSLIRERLEAENIQLSYLDGKTNKRLDLVNAFNEEESSRVFLISLKAGGTGLNLTAADYVFLVDPWWNPAAESQAIDRAHRIGQKSHVFAYKMICENSIEEKILKLQEKKKELSEEIIHAQENFVKALSKKDVEILFS